MEKKAKLCFFAQLTSAGENEAEEKKLLYGFFSISTFSFFFFSSFLVHTFFPLSRFSLPCINLLVKNRYLLLLVLGIL